eukprot:COSAG04_NODE_214_length_20089_cov_206.678189_13_plen_94_part_00
MRRAAALLALALPATNGFCTCPDIAAVCTTADLFSSSGEDDCVPSAGGLLDATLSIPTTTLLEVVSLSGIVRVSGDVNVRAACIARLARRALC